MQIKSIRKAIESKMNDWLTTISDPILSLKVKNNLLVTGGCISSMLQNEDVNDFDVYIQDRQVLIALVKYYIKEFPSINIWLGEDKKKIQKNYSGDFEKDNNYFTCSLRNLKDDQVKLFIDDNETSNTGGLRVDKKGDDKYQVAYFSPNAISLSDDVQLVIRFFGTPEQIHKTFDFVHATNYFTFYNGVVTNKEALESILTKQLRYQGSLYPLTSVIRSKKFIRRGFSISAGEYLKMLFQISELDLTNLDTLEEQLIGVDVAYFAIIIQALRNKKESEPSFNVTNSYLVTLIDKVFN